MKVKMTEHYQDASVTLQPDQAAEVDDVLGAWLVKHRKAYVFTEEIVVKFTEQKEAFRVSTPIETEPEPAEIPVANTQDAPKRARRGK